MSAAEPDQVDRREPFDRTATMSLAQTAGPGGSLGWVPGSWR
jgi:hypothetical protein